MALTPEEHARKTIDEALHNAGWDVQDVSHVNVNATQGVAIREFPLNWLRVSGTAELTQIDQRVRHQLHAIVPLLDAFKAEQ